MLATVDRRDSSASGALIKAFIAEKATIYSDEWPACMSFFRNVYYEHLAANHN